MDSKRVLVVEDNPAMGNVIRFNLEQAGLDVEWARNGLEAWQHLEDDAYDLVVSDYQMPQMDGWELCSRMRASARHRATPVIMLTAKELELDSARTIDELRIDGICPKPFSPSELTKMVMTRLGLTAAQKHPC